MTSKRKKLIKKLDLHYLNIKNCMSRIKYLVKDTEHMTKLINDLDYNDTDDDKEMTNLLKIIKKYKKEIKATRLLIKYSIKKIDMLQYKISQSK